MNSLVLPWVPEVVKGISLDYDDNLVETLDRSIELILSVGREMGYNSRTPEQVKIEWGRNLREIASSLWEKMGEQDVDEFVRRMEEKEMHEEPALVPHVKETLATLLAQKYTLSISTGRYRSTFQHQFSRFLGQVGLQESDFLFTQCGDETIYEKSDQGFFYAPLTAFDKVEIHRKNVLHIGDSLHDMHGARNAGIGFIAVLTGATIAEEFRKEKTATGYIPQEHILPDISYVPEWIRNE